MNTPHAPTWGTSKLGGGSTPAMFHAIPVGIITAAAVGLVSGALTSPDGWSWVHFLAFAGCTVVPLIMVAWVFLKRDGTMPDDVAKPQLTIEHQWTKDSGKSAFLTLVGMAAAGLLFSGLRLVDDPVNLTIMICSGTVLVIGWAAFFISYAWQKRNG